MASSGDPSSNKRRLDNFLENFITSSYSSPSRPGSRMSTPSQDRAALGTPSSPAEILESFKAKRLRLGLDGAPSYTNRATTSSVSLSASQDVLRQKSSWTAPGTGLGAFGSSSRTSLLQTSPSTAGSKQHQSTVPAPAPVLYNPGDRDALITRLASFQDMTDWTPKPERVSEIEWAKKGWICRGRERVACPLCKRELVVGLNRKEVDGKEVPVLVASEIEDALVDKYVEMMVSEHLEDCPWRKFGCDDSLMRVSLGNSRDALVELRRRYDELLDRKDFLPYIFNLRMPADLDLDSILLDLPPDFFNSDYIQPSASAPASVSASASASAPTLSTFTDEPPNRVALALSLFGWQRLSNPRMGAVRDTISCHTCLRRLGLWMFKSKEVSADGTVISPAPMDHLDPVAEHRFFCPWKNVAAQRVNYSTASSNGTDAAAWARVVQVIRNEASIRGALDRRHRKSFIDRRLGGNSSPSASAKDATAATDGPTAPDTPGAASAATDDGDDDEGTRVGKEKGTYSRLRRIKSLFLPKDKDKDKDKDKEKNKDQEKGRRSRAMSRASLGMLSSPPTTPRQDTA